MFWNVPSGRVLVKLPHPNSRAVIVAMVETQLRVCVCSGCGVMFFVRIAFFVLIVLVLLPSNMNEKAEFHRTIDRIGTDVTTFCDRNGEICEKTTGFFGTLYQKMLTTVEMLEDMLKSPSGGDNGQMPRNGDRNDKRQRSSYNYDNGRSDTAAMTLQSQDTLTPSDLRPHWNGPKPLPARFAYGNKSR